MPLLEVTGAPDLEQPFTARVAPAGPASAYFNPALLLEVPSGVSAAAVVVIQRLSTALSKRPSGADVSDAIEYARRLLPNGDTAPLELHPMVTAELPVARGSALLDRDDVLIALGLTEHFWGGRAAIGFYAVLPTGSVQSGNVFYADEREQYFSNSLHFERFEDRLISSGFALALAGKPWDFLSIGVGLSIGTASRTVARVFQADAIDRERTIIDNSIEVGVRLAPHAGLSVTPFPGLRLTATIHAPVQNDIDGTTDLRLWNYDPPGGQETLLQDFSFSGGALPLRAGLGAAYALGGEALRIDVALGWLWARWSAYRDRHQELPQGAWSDSHTFTFGGTIHLGRHRLGLGTAFEPSPVPAQAGRTSYVDPDRVGLGLGYGFDFELWGIGVAIVAQAQVQLLLEQSAVKSATAPLPVLDEFPDAIDARTGALIGESAGLQTNNPGYPGFAADGKIYSSALSLRIGL